MSAWAIMTSIGLFQTDGGCRVDPVYEIASPIFEEVTIDLGERYGRGKKFTIKAHNASRRNIYVQSARLNGRQARHVPLPGFGACCRAGSLVLEMGPEPNKSLGSEITPEIRTRIKAEQCSAFIRIVYWPAPRSMISLRNAPPQRPSPTLRTVLQTNPAPGLSLHRRIQPYRTPSRRCSHTAVSAASDTDPAVSAAPPFQPAPQTRILPSQLPPPDSAAAPSIVGELDRIGKACQPGNSRCCIRRVCRLCRARSVCARESARLR